MNAPVVVVNVVPPLPSGQDQRMAQESPPAARYERWIARSLATLLSATQRPPVNQASKPPEQGNPARTAPAAAKHAASQAPGVGRLVGSRASLTGGPKKWTEQPIPGGPSGVPYWAKVSAERRISGDGRDQRVTTGTVIAGVQDSEVLLDGRD